MRRATGLLVALLMTWLGAVPAHANMASPIQPGSAAGEPVALAGLRVSRERLTLDLRPLARSGLAMVEAEYLIVNEGTARRVPLSFVALGDGVRSGEVWLDGVPVPAQPVDDLAIPAAWRVATTTPALGDAPSPYEADTFGVAGLAFALDIAPGRHLVRVRYRVRPGSYDAGDHPNRVWQVAYSLAPARFWAGFGSIDVTVRMPAGWEAAASLPLRREGDALVATFAGVPGDVLSVSTRAPVPRGLIPLRLAALVLALGLCAVAGWLGGTVTARRRLSVRWAWLASFVGGVAGAGALATLTLTAAGLGDSSAYGYGRGIVMLFVVAPLAVVVGTLLAQTVAVRTHRRHTT